MESYQVVLDPRIQHSIAVRLDLHLCPNQSKKHTEIDRVFEKRL